MYTTVIPYTGMHCIKTLVLGNRCSIKHAFWPFSDYGFSGIRCGIKPLSKNGQKACYGCTYS